MGMLAEFVITVVPACVVLQLPAHTGLVATGLPPNVKLHSAATETDRAAVRISTLVPPAEGCTGVSCAAQSDAQATCSLTVHQIAQFLFIAVIQLAVNRHPCLQNMSAPSALTVLIQGAMMHNNPDYSFDFIRRVILNTVMMLLEQLNSQRL